MSEWNFFDAASRGNVMRVWQQEAEGMLALAERPENWEAPTAAGHWQVRDVIAHLVDTTEGYFKAFDAARGQGEPWDPVGVRDMAKHVDEGAMAFRGTPQDELIGRLRDDLAKMRGIAEELSDEEWAGGLQPVHKYMGPLPAAIYPEFQVVDYAVHSWDMRCGLGGGHNLEGDAADLLVPVSLILWQSTNEVGPDVDPFELGVRVTSGGNAGDYRISVSPEGLNWEAGDVDDLPVTIEFDPADLVLTAFGRFNGGTARGDRALAERFLSVFFRI